MRNSSGVIAGLTGGRSGGRPNFVVDALHLVVLFNVALVLPLFEVLGRSGPFFVAHRARPLDLFLFVVVVCLLLPSLLVLLEGVVGLVHRQVRQAVHILLVAVLLVPLGLVLLDKLGGLPGVGVLAGATLLGVLGAAVYARVRDLRLYLSYLAVGLLVIPGNFLFNSEVTKVLLPAADPTSAAVRLGQTPPIVMVVFDELPLSSLLDQQQQLDRGRYPNFAALADDAYWFRQATTVADQTLYALPAIVSGEYPTPGKLPVASDYPQNLFTLLGGAYRLEVQEAGTELCPLALCGTPGQTPTGLAGRLGPILADAGVVLAHIVVPNGLDAGLPPLSAGWNDFLAPGDSESGGSEKGFVAAIMGNVNSDRASRFAEFVERIDRSTEPTLYFLHTPLPHIPWIYLPSGKVHSLDTATDGLAHDRWSSNDWLVTQAYQRHLLQVGYADTLLGEVVGKLKATGLYDDALIVVVADHGVSFHTDECRRCVTERTSGEILPVPLLVKLPQQHSGVVSDEHVQVIDILPTIARVLEADVPWQFDGHAALENEQPNVQIHEKFLSTGKAYQDYDFTSVFGHLTSAVMRKIELFGSGTMEGLFAIGPYQGLVGRNTNELTLAGQADAVAQLDAEEAYADLDLTAEVVPARITGQIRLNDGENQRLAVAVGVNGVIRAVTQTTSQGALREKFSAMVPEESFREGPNVIEFFLVSGPENSPTITSVERISPASYALEEENQDVLVIDGETIPIVGDAANGYLDNWKQIGDRVHLAGWAVDLETKRFPKAVVAFVNGEAVAVSQSASERPDVAEFLKDDRALHSGYSLDFASQAFDGSAEPEVRVFAITERGEATELTYGSAFPWKPAN